MRDTISRRLDREIKLIALDLDGTLMNEQDDITEKTIEKLKELADLGIYIVPATGRCAALIHQKLLAIPQVRYGITENGACLWDFHCDAPVTTTLLPTGAAELIFATMENEKGYLELFAGGKAYANRRDIDRCREQVPNQYFVDYFLENHEFVDSVKDYGDLSEKAEKINLFYLEDRVRLPLAEKLRNMGKYQVTSSMRGNIEVNDATANKGTALEELCRYLNIDQKQTIAIGDGDNDIEMMEAAGVGIAMDNADSRVKGAADYITKNNDDEGVLWILEQLL